MSEQEPDDERAVLELHYQMVFVDLHQAGAVCKALNIKSPAVMTKDSKHRPPEEEATAVEELRSIDLSLSERLKNPEFRKENIDDRRTAKCIRRTA